MSTIDERLAAIGLEDYEPVSPPVLAVAPEPSTTSPQLAEDDPGDGWPLLHADAYHGPIGAYVRDAAPHTEADPAAVLVQLLAGVGALANNGPHTVAGNDRHPAALFVAVVGTSGSGAKGTAGAVAKLPLRYMDPDFTRNRILGGFGSGEVLIETLAEPGTDDRPRDGRMLIFENELGAILRVAGRGDAVLGQRLRDTWDGRRLQARTRGRGTVEVLEGDYHVALIGHITAEELRDTLSTTDTFGGTTNRLIWAASRRTQLLPEGGNVPDEVAQRAAKVIGRNLATARRHGRLERTPEARALWADYYRQLAEDDPGGMLGAAIARGAPQNLRLALVYAIADGSPVVDVCHLRAAWAVWRYSRATAEVLFPPLRRMADDLLGAVVDAGPDGLARRSVHALFARHATAAQIERAVAELVAAGLVTEQAVPTGGRPRQVLRAVEK